MLEVVQRVQDEVEFVVSNFDFALEPGQALQNYLHHRKVLSVLLTLNLIYELLLLIYIIVNHEFIIAQLGEIYRNLSMEAISQAFLTGYSVDIAINLFVYSTGYYALWTHKAKFYNIFNNLLLFAVFSTIVISYLNVLNLLVFVMKIVVYLYSRFILSILYTVLVIPRDIQLGNEEGRRERV